MPEVLPANAEHVRKVVEDRLAALKESDGIKQTVTVEWRGKQEPMPVISMPLELLSYNPGTHRVRAQRSLDPVRDQELESNPYGSPAQAYLHHLLMGDPADPSKTDPTFQALMEDLREHGQTDPGIITRAGILINGNTRRAALKELGQQDIRVGVLPSDAGFEDQQSIELSLQLRKDHKRDYSFMNFLLAIDERVQAGWTAEKIQREFRIKAKTFDRSRWILTAVGEVIERSKVQVADGRELSMRLVDFETHQGKLEELFRTYQSLKAKAPADAEALREQRLLAIALDKSKTDVRLIEPDFVDRYMKSVMPEAGGEVAASSAKIPGTSITVAGHGEKVEQLKKLTTQILQAKAITLAPEEATPAAVVKASAALETVQVALEDALEQAGKTGRLVKKRFAPVDRLSDANDDIELTLGAVADARATGNFDADDLDEVLVSLKTNLLKLAQAVTRDATTEAEGVAWLRALSRLPETTGS